MGQGRPSLVQSGHLSAGPGNGHAPTPAAHSAPQTPPVSTLRIQFKRYKAKNLFGFLILNAQNSMSSARDRFLVIIFNTIMQKAHPGNKVSGCSRPPHIRVYVRNARCVNTETNNPGIEAPQIDGSAEVRISVSRTHSASSTYPQPVRNRPTIKFGMGSVSADKESANRKAFGILELSVAQTVRPWYSESLGRRFESYRAHQTHRNPGVIGF